MVTVEEYKKILNDYKTSDELIKRRIEYITALCRNVARNEINIYVKKSKSEQKYK